ncbi:MAG: hypothetical protein JXR63_10930 [Spirochaetales bacterium]|nr:hypothetical protein [Spirochaetales bacterium]
MKKILIFFILLILLGCKEDTTIALAYEKAMVAYSENRIIQAKELSAKLPNSEPEYILLKAGISFSEKDFTRTIELLEEKNKLFGLSKFASYILIRSYLNLGEFEKGENLLREMLKDDPADFRAISLFGDLKILQKDIQSAIFLYENSVDACSEIAASCLKLAQIYKNHGQAKQADLFFNKALVLIGPKDPSLSREIEKEIQILRGER